MLDKPSCQSLKRLRMTAFVSVLALCAATGVSAQTPPVQTSDKTSDQAITVTGTRPEVSNKIDRRVYDVKGDPQAQTGTTADVLNNVPSVNVDADGNVSLRGNSQVQVLINGKPSAMMQGDSRGASLLSMSAEDVDSIEVITNPSSQFRSEGGGGIINIVLKKNRRIANNGSFIANIGNDNRYNGALSGTINKGKFTLNGGLNLRKDGRRFQSVTDRQRLSSGSSTRTRSSSNGEGERNSTSLRLGMDYNPTDYDTFSTEINLSERGRDNLNLTQTLNETALGAPVNNYSRLTSSNGLQQDASLRAAYEHRFARRDGENLKFELRRSTSAEKNDQVFTDTYVFPMIPIERNRILRQTSTTINQLSVDYSLPFEDGSQLMTGLDLEQEQDRFDNYAAGVNLSTGNQTLDASRTNLYKITQTLSAAYINYQRRLGTWDVLWGARLENIEFDLNQVTGNISDNNSYLNLNPSLIFSHNLGERAKVKASYSRRMQKPAAADLNPFIVYRDPQNVSSGNSELKPMSIDSFEVGYEYGTQPLSFTTSLYYRKSYDTITDFSTFINPEVLLTTKRNFGQAQSGGLEYSMNGKVSPKLSYSFNLNVFYAEVQAFDTGKTRSDVSYSGKAGLDYRPTQKDRFQINGSFQGDTLTSQGSRSGTNILNLGYRRQMTPKLALNVTANDALADLKFTSKTDTRLVREVTSRQISGPTVFIGLSYTLGAPPRRPGGDNIIPDRVPGGRGGGGFGS
jgi:outer membrane receptor protein involved in Fe transport